MKKRLSLLLLAFLLSPVLTVFGQDEAKEAPVKPDEAAKPVTEESPAGKPAAEPVAREIPLNIDQQVASCTTGAGKQVLLAVGVHRMRDGALQEADLLKANVPPYESSEHKGGRGKAKPKVALMNAEGSLLRDREPPRVRCGEPGGLLWEKN